MSGDFGFDSDPFKVVKSGEDFFGGSSNSTADSSRSGASMRKLQRSKSSDENDGYKQPMFPDPSFGGDGGGGVSAAAQRASRSRRRASIATSSTLEASNTEANSGGDFGNFDQPNFDAPSFDQPSFEAPAPAQREPARRPGRSRRASVVGSGMGSGSSNPDAMTRSNVSSRSIDTSGTGMEAISRTNKSSRNLGSRSNASVGSNEGSGGNGPSNPGAAAAAGAPPPRRRTNRRGSIAAFAMAAPEAEPEPEPEPEPEADYGYGEDPEPDADYGYGDSEPSGFGNSDDQPRDTFAAGAPPKSSRRMSCMPASSNPNSNDPFESLKSGGAFGDGGFTGTTSTSTKPSLGSGSSRQLNIMLPMTSAGPEKPKEPAPAARSSRRRASMLGMVGNLTGGGGGADKMQSLDDDEKKGGKSKGFFKDRNGAAPSSRNASGEPAKPSHKDRDRRREGGLLDRLDATAPSSRGEGRSQGVSYSDRIMKN
jgi:hypothetical protein